MAEQAPRGIAEVWEEPDGTILVRDLGSRDYRQVSRDELEAAQSSGGEAFLGNIGRAVEAMPRATSEAIGSAVRRLTGEEVGGEAVAGPQAPLPQGAVDWSTTGALPAWDDVQAGEANRARLQQIADQQRGASGANPVLGPLGSIVPDVALAAGTLGTGVTGSLARRGALYGAEGFVMGAGASPEDPLTGGLLGLAVGPLGGLGGEVITRGLVRGLGKGRAIIGASRRMDPPEAPAGTLRGVDPEAPGGMAGVRQGDIAGPPGSITGVDPRAVGAAHNRGWGTRAAGMWDGTPDEALNREAAELGFRLTPGVQRGSTSLRQIEANMESTPGGAAAFAGLREQNQEALQGHLVRALGGEGTDLSPAALGRMKDTLEQTFDDTADALGDVNLQGALRDLNRQLKEIDDPDVHAWASRYADKVPAEMTGRSLMSKLQNWRKNADDEWSSGHKGKARALDDLADIVEKHMLRQAPAQVGEALKDAAQRWRLLRTVERGNTITSDGLVSPNSLNQALRGGYKNAYRYDKATGHPDIDTMSRAARVAYAMREIVGNSGTATRSQNPLEAVTVGPLHHAYAKSYLQGLDLKDYLKAGAAGAVGVVGVRGLLGE